MSLHREIELEKEICGHLGARGWLYEEGDAAGYDRKLALFPADLMAWVKATQPDAWEALAKNHGAAAETTLLDRARKQLRTRMFCYGRPGPGSTFADGCDPQCPSKPSLDRFSGPPVHLQGRRVAPITTPYIVPLTPAAADGAIQDVREGREAACGVGRGRYQGTRPAFGGTPFAQRPEQRLECQRGKDVRN